MKKSQSMWFENLAQGRDGALRLFCFPYAGGSAQVLRGWQRHFAPQAALSLAHLPGRAARVGEPPFKQYKPLVNALADAIIPELFLGSRLRSRSGGTSWGLISFEQARALCRWPKRKRKQSRLAGDHFLYSHFHRSPACRLRRDVLDLRLESLAGYQTRT